MKNNVEKILDKEYCMLSSLNDKLVKNWDINSYRNFQSEVETNIKNKSNYEVFKHLIDLYRKVFD